MVAKFIPLGVLVDSLVDLAQALIARFELQEKFFGLVVKAKKTQNPTEPSISTNINNLTFSDANTVNNTPPEELYMQRKGMSDLTWATAKYDNVGIYEIQSIPQLGVICYGGDKTRDESHSVYIGTLESNGLFHYPLYFGMSLFDYLLCCLCCKCSCTRECRIGNNDNSNDSTNNTNVIAPAENINEPDALPGNEEYLAVINQIEGPALSITRELTSFQKQIKDFEDSCKDANVDNNTIDQQASHLDEIIEKLKAWQTTYPENRELSAILTRAISLLKIIEDGEEGDDELLQADPQFL